MSKTALPQPQLDVRHAVSVCVGMVIGAGIFKTSPMVAGALASDTQLYLAWAFGGLLSLVGALCFAEMAAAFPDAGGDYHFLRRAYGQRLGFLFAWSRFAVIHTGSMALLAFVFGDYLAQAIDLSPWLGPYANAVLAAGLILLLTALNLAGVRVGLGTQLGLMSVVLGGLALLGGAGVSLGDMPPQTPLSTAGATPDWGTAMIFVFLAYGGWSDAATLSAEMRDAKHGIARALLIGLALVMGLYLLANWAYLQGLGLAGLAASEAPAADLMRAAFGRGGELLIVGIVTLTALSVMNAILIAGPRTTYAAARDLARELHLGKWNAKRGTPTAAVLATSGVALALVGFGAATRGGFSTMVDYLSPVYWFFLCLSGAAVIVLRRREPDAPRPFKVPLYPLLPLLFVGCCAYLLYASLVYVKAGALVGVAVLGGGAMLLWPMTRKGR
ncbi:amino acid/polyamine/organocation transporter (APC superfamily) [Roseateles asaccharophilus]|uniref:Amino acid/polyamine/organocation transporter (APC superfamily) n=1 Tax=Roseateles asaccharophilus TaxID=582607 RepID=A0A4R6NB76_9BURK|nr:APC family permease [Roseateles asaccharophilus]TDP13039.1 amino acid/polyamine/organocation transporter (APC superfamily) [Roseateles asaccharophilus]